MREKTKRKKRKKNKQKKGRKKRRKKRRKGVERHSKNDNKSEKNHQTECDDNSTKFMKVPRYIERLRSRRIDFSIQVQD